jgi:hypothetical protein
MPALVGPALKAVICFKEELSALATPAIAADATIVERKCILIV